MADVIARQMLYALFGMWQMLLPRGRWLSSFVWQMLLPMECGRCFYHSSVLQLLIDWCYCQVADGIATCCLFVFYAVWADVIALWQMEWPHLYICDGRCYCPVADGIATAGCECSLLVDVVLRGQMDMGNYFILSSEVLCRTSSHIWGRWYLPMFLFGDGLFTLMYNASLIHLQRFWSSLPTMLKLSKVTMWPVVL